MHNVIELLNQNTTLLLALSFFIGACIGSFINVAIHRIPIMLERQWAIDQSGNGNDNDIKNQHWRRFDLAWPGSHCPKCHTPIKTIDNLPLLSYLWLKGKCRHCHNKIARRYLLIEFGVAVLAASLIGYFGLNLKSIAIFLFICWMICLSAIDFRHRLLPDMLTLSLLWLGLIFNLNELFIDINDAIIGAIVGYLTFWLIYQIHHLISGKHGMGYGDFKLFAAIGAWLGWQALPAVALFASLSGILYAIFMRIGNAEHKIIPFGPFLACGGIIMLLFGEQILSAYLNWVL